MSCKQTRPHEAHSWRVEIGQAGHGGFMDTVTCPGITSYPPASQDYRDGAAYGAAELARRINSAQSYGLNLSNRQITTMADEIAKLMGGHEPIQEAADSGKAGS